MSQDNLSGELPRVKAGLTASSLNRNGYKVEVEAQGSVFKVHVCAPSHFEKSPGVSPECTEGDLLDVVIGGDKDASSVAGKRGKVDGLSWPSRLRFLEKVKRVSTEILPLFITLTLPNVVDCFEGRFPTAAEMKSHLEKFRKRMLRKFPKFACFWRLEVQESRFHKWPGQGIPYHFHLLAWGLDAHALKYVRAKVAVMWTKSLGAISAARTEVAVVKTFKGVAHYAAKYLCKAVPKAVVGDGASLSLSHIPPSEMTGRVWGMLNAASLPWAELIEFTESFGQWFFQLRRSASTIWNFSKSRVQGFRLFRELSEEWINYALQLIG